MCKIVNIRVSISTLGALIEMEIMSTHNICFG